MTLIAPTDVQSISLPDGCGKSHGIEAGAQLVIECGPCEAAMSAHKHLGWAATPEQVALTCDERAQAERDEASAQKAGIARLNSLANGGDGSANGALTALVEQNTALMAQNAAMMEKVAGLTAQLAGNPGRSDVGSVAKVLGPDYRVGGYADPAVDPTASPVLDVNSAPASKPAKRAPGRPKSAKAE